MSEVTLRLLPFPSLYLHVGRFASKSGLYCIAVWCILRAMRLEVAPGLVFTPPAKRKFLGNHPRISVIIPTCNRMDSLRRCLDSIYCQSLSPEAFEVIVVNNCCTDRTVDLCAHYAQEHSNFLLVDEPIPGLLAARHAGWRAAAADVLTFCDDDIEAVPGWLETIDSIFSEQPDVYLVGGNCTGSFDADLPEWFAELWEEYDGLRMNRYYSLLEGVNSLKEVEPGIIFGCNFSARRSVWEEAGGAGPDCMANMLFQGEGENRVCDAASRVGRKAVLHPGASVRHHMPANRLTLPYMRRRGIYASIGIGYSMFRYGYVHESLPPTLHILPGDNPALHAVAEGLRQGFLVYLESLFENKALREWVRYPTYFGAEAPPTESLMEASMLTQRLGW